MDDRSLFGGRTGVSDDLELVGPFVLRGGVSCTGGKKSFVDFYVPKCPQNLLPHFACPKHIACSRIRFLDDVALLLVQLITLFATVFFTLFLLKTTKESRQTHQIFRNKYKKPLERKDAKRITKPT